MKKRGRGSDHFSHSGFSIPHTYVGLFIALLMVFISILSLNDFSSDYPTSAVVVGENASFGYLGPETVVFSDSVTMDLEYYFNESGLTFLATDPATADVTIVDSVLTLTTNETVGSYNVFLVASRASDFLSVPVLFVKDVTLTPTPVVYPFYLATFTGQDEFGLDIDPPVIDTLSKSVSYTYENAGGFTSLITLSNVTSYDSTTVARVGSAAELSTEIFAVEDIDVESATLVLAKNGVVDYVYQCVDFDTVTYTCPSSWTPTPIPFSENSTHVWFTVDSFSGYGGGANNNTLVFDCSSLTDADTTYTLNNDVSATGICFDIIDDKITLDCAGHSVSVENTSAPAIVADGVNEFTLENCDVETTNTTAPGVFVKDSTGSRIVKSSVTGTGGIRFDAVSLGVVEDSFVNGSNESLVFIDGFDNTVIDNTLAGPRSLVLDGVSDTSLVSNVFVNMTQPIRTENASSITMTNTTFEGDDTYLRFGSTITLPSSQVIGYEYLKLHPNIVFLDSDAMPFLNTSAQITFKGVEYVDPRIGVSYNDDGNYLNCTAPQCNIVYNDAPTQTLIFNVSHFTSYSSSGESGGFSSLVSVTGSIPNVALSCGEMKFNIENLFSVFAGAFEFQFSCQDNVRAEEIAGDLKVTAGNQNGVFTCTVTASGIGDPASVTFLVEVTGCPEAISGGTGGLSSKEIEERVFQRTGKTRVTDPRKASMLNVRVYQVPLIVTNNPLAFAVVPGVYIVPIIPGPGIPPGWPPWIVIFPPSAPPPEDGITPGPTITTVPGPTPDGFVPPFERTITRPPPTPPGEGITVTTTARPPSPFCGNNVRDADLGEECDGTDKGICGPGFKCGDKGTAKQCKCVKLPRCMDGVLDAGEDCENAAHCAAKFGGTGWWCVGAGAKNECTCHTTVPACGDGILDPDEECESDMHCEVNEKFGPGYKCSPPGVTEACKCFGPDTPPGKLTDFTLPPGEQEELPPYIPVPYIPPGPGQAGVPPGQLPPPVLPEDPSGYVVLTPPPLPPEILETLVPEVPPEEVAAEVTPEVEPTPFLNLPPPPILIGPPFAPITTVPNPPTTLTLPAPNVIGPTFTPPHVAAPPTKISPDTSAVCIYAASPSGAPITINSALAPSEGLPEGYEIASDPIKVNCNEELDVTVAVPKNFVDLQAYRCVGSICSPVASEATGEQLYCGSNSLDTLVMDIINPGRTFIYRPGLIGAPFTEVTEDFPRFDAEGYALIFDELQEPISMHAYNPVQLDPPLNPLLGFASVPITLSFDGDVYQAEIRAQYHPTAVFEPSSYQLYAIDGKTYIPLDSEIDHATQTLVVTVSNLDQLIKNDKLTLVVLATVCDACTESMFERVYDGGSKDAIILVHGFSSSSLTWAPLIEEFKLTRSPKQVWVFSYPSYKSLATISQDLADYASAQSNQYNSITFVGHSLGGLVVQKALQTGGPFVSKTKKALLVGSPNEGSPIASIYKDVLQLLVNSRTFTRPLPGRLDLISSLLTGENIPPVGGVTYEVIAGTESFPFASALFTSTNDGVTTTQGAQHVGNRFISDKCKDYFELGMTHTQLIDFPLGRRIVTHRLSDVSAAHIGNNQYVRMQIDKCSPSDVYVIVGRPISEQEQFDLLGCNCGNGVCGIGEDQYSCPSDCIIEEQPASLWDQYKNIVWMALMILVAMAIAVSLLIYFSKKSHPKLAKTPPGPAVPPISQIKSMGTKGAIAPKIVEPRVEKKKEEPAPPPIDKKLLQKLYKWPLKKKPVRDPALEALEKQVKKEAKRNLKKK